MEDPDLYSLDCHSKLDENQEKGAFRYHHARGLPLSEDISWSSLYFNASQNLECPQDIGKNGHSSKPVMPNFVTA
jgi:hypothetical protein